MKLARYPWYKPSGVEWLGEVPEHWEVKRLKATAAYWVSNVDKVPTEDEMPVRLCNYTDVYYHDHIRPDMGLMEGTATPGETRRFGLRVGDVVITKDSEDWSDIAVPALVVESSPDLVCGYHLAIIRPDQLLLTGPFALRALQACAVNQQFQVAATGVTRYGLPKSAIGEAWLPLPDVDEQRAIADFLDYETAKIDTLVARKRTLIERLKEKRTALISRIVTRGLPPDAATQAGLDPHPNLKPSGIDWLGDVPEHWDVVSYKRVCNRVDVGIAEAATHAYCDDGVPLIRSTNVKLNRLDTSDLLRIESVFAQKNRSKTLRAGDLVTVRTGYPGTTAIVPDDLDGAQCFTLVLSSPKSTMHGPYFSWMLNSKPGRSYFEMTGWGTAQTNISVPIVQFMPVPRPPLREQVAIAAYLDVETTKIDTMAAKVEAAIERLQEYRTALITAAVTGKIDVRGMGSGVAGTYGSVPSAVRTAATGCTSCVAGHAGGRA